VSGESVHDALCFVLSPYEYLNLDAFPSSTAKWEILFVEAAMQKVDHFMILKA
jgi:hypothetical protein